MATQETHGGIAFAAREPRQYRMGAILIAGVGSALLVGLAALLLIGGAMHVALAGIGTAQQNLLLAQFLLCMAAVMWAMFYFLPFMAGGNWYVRRVVRRLGLPGEVTSGGHVFQIEFRPRLCSGLRALLDDADDVGVLRLDDEALTYHGDRVTLAVPYAAVRSLRARNIGWRSLWLGGKRIEIVAGDGERELTFELLEREAHTLPTARHVSEAVLAILTEKVRQAGE